MHIKERFSWLDTFVHPERYGRHLSYQMTQTCVETGFRMLTIFYLSYVLGPRYFGKLALILAGVSFFQNIIYGLWNSLVKFTAERKAIAPREGVALGWWGAIAIVVFSVLLCAVSLLVFPLVDQLIPQVDHSAVWLGLAVVVVLAAKLSLEAGLRGIKDFFSPALAALLSSPLQLVLVLMVLRPLSGIRDYLLILIFMYAVNIFILLLLFRKHVGTEIIRAGIRRYLPYVKQVFEYAAPLVVRGLVYFFYLRINIVIVSYFSGAEEAGYLGLAERFLLLPLLVMGAFMEVMAPRAAEHHSRQAKKKLEQLTAQVNFAIVAAMVPFFLLYLNAGILIRLFFPAYEPVELMLKLLAPFLLIKALASVALSGLLIPCGYARLAAILGILSSAANVLINLVLVPPLGALGSIIGVIVVHSISGVVMIFYAYRLLGLRFRVRFSLAP